MNKQVEQAYQVVTFSGVEYEFDYDLDRLTFAEIDELERVTGQQVFGTRRNVNARLSSAFQWFAIRKRNPKATFADVQNGVKPGDISIRHRMVDAVLEETSAVDGEDNDEGDAAKSGDESSFVSL